MSDIYPQISIIIPVYKAEVYLHRCIDSLLSQTLQNFEILLIDDGSPDRSGEICDKYTQIDDRVRVFHKENGGVSSARNLGIGHAKGEWITFIDSDDYVDKSFLSDFGLEKLKADIYMQGYRIEKKFQVISVHNFLIDYICLTTKSVCFVEGEFHNILNSPVCKLFRRDVIENNDLKFDCELSFGEDHLFTLSYLACIQTIALSPSYSYTYVHSDEQSLTRRVVPYFEIFYYAIKCNKAQRKLVSEKKMLKAVNWRTYSNLMLLLKNFYKLKPLSIDNYRNIRRDCLSLDVGYYGLKLYQKYLVFILFKIPVILSYCFFYLLFSLYRK